MGFVANMAIAGEYKGCSIRPSKLKPGYYGIFQKSKEQVCINRHTVRSLRLIRVNYWEKHADFAAYLWIAIYFAVWAYTPTLLILESKVAIAPLSVLMLFSLTALFLSLAIATRCAHRRVFLVEAAFVNGAVSLLHVNRKLYNLLCLVTQPPEPQEVYNDMEGAAK